MAAGVLAKSPASAKIMAPLFTHPMSVPARADIAYHAFCAHVRDPIYQTKLRYEASDLLDFDTWIKGVVHWQPENELWDVVHR